MDNIFAQFGQPSAEEMALQQQWIELKTAVAAHNVIPVIGPNLQIAPVALTGGGETLNAQRILIQELVKWLHVEGHPRTFSDLLFDKSLPKDYDRRCIYAQLSQLFQGDLSQLFKPHAGLKRLLETKRFPFVITTCFTPMVEHIMREVWGDQLRVRVFDNDPKNRCDIDTDTDLDRPTVFYMFGKAANPRQGSFVVTDGDMLTFCQAWMDDARRPKNLVSLLQKRYLLMLGTDYSDWLCRFVLHSMKPNQKTGMVVCSSEEDSLQHFLRRMDNFIQSDDVHVIDELCNRIAEDSVREEVPAPLNTDVFISYSRRDAEVAERLYKALEARGIHAWYDRRALKIGDDFMREIRRSIASTRLFVPILSNNIYAERNESHPYRIEWEVAIAHAGSLGRSFIIPLSEQGFDFYAAQLPEGLNKHNAAMYDPAAPDLDSFADEIQKILETIK